MANTESNKGLQQAMAAPNLRSKLALGSCFERVKSDLKSVDARIRQQAEAFDPGIVAYVDYATDSGGKRIRPALALLSARATGELDDGHIDLAVIVELIHLASLVHDDVLDGAEFRRKRPTLHTKWGREVAVLLGDCLFAHALRLCTDFEDSHLSKEIAGAANEVCTGEILQTQRKYDLKLSVPEYLRIVGMKTGALFRVSTELAAYYNKRPASEVVLYRSYGQSLGTAYQIYDDCIDLFGSEEEVGKTLGTDLDKGKLTLPVLHMISQLSNGDLEEVSSIILNNESDKFESLVQRVINSGGHLYALRKAQELLTKADELLETVEQNAYTDALRQLPRLIREDLSSLKT